MYSTHNEGKSVVSERLIRNLQNKIYEYMTSISKNVLTDKLDDIVNKYNNTYHSKIKMKLVDVKSSIYIDSSNEIKDEDLNLKLPILLEYVPNWSEEDYGIKKVKSTVLWTYVISELKGEEIVETFYKKG